MLKLDVEVLFKLQDSRFSLLARDDGGVLALPSYRGEPIAERPPPFFARDGLAFAAAAVDLSRLSSPAAPVVSMISDHHPVRHASEDNLVFLVCDSASFELTVGPEVILRPSRYRAPERSFQLRALTRDGGLLWAGGHDSRDVLLGQLHFSEDGASWSRVPGKHDTVKRFVRHGGKLYALWFKSVDQVTTSGLVSVARLKTHVDDAVFGAAGLVGIGPDLGVGVIAPRSKRAKYSAPLAPRSKGRLAAIEGGFLLGDLDGLRASSDGVSWELAASYGPRGVAAVVPSRDHAVVLSTEGELLAVRFA